MHQFPEGRKYKQWTGDDSKALVKVRCWLPDAGMSQTVHLQVYISAIKRHVPDNMVECVAAFMEVCYLVQQDKISTMDLEMIDKGIIHFHRRRQVFIDTGVRVSVSLPRQHALVHYLESIVLFGSPNRLCSSITEAKHIKAVKEPWR